MKKIAYHLFLVTIAATALYSCRSSVKTEFQQFQQTYCLTEDTLKGALRVDMQVEFPAKYKNVEALNLIRHDIIGKIFGNKYTGCSNEELLRRFAEDMYKDYKVNNLPFVNEEDTGETNFSYNNDYMLEAFCLLNDGRIFSYGISQYVYTGGAHGISNRSFYNYSLNDGKPITEKDLFDGDYKTSLTELIMKHFIENNGDIRTREDLEEIYYTDQIVPNDNFYITRKSINYVFNPYEIAPYAWGQTEVSIPFEELQELLKPQSPINYLINK